jgi:nucleoside-diphosphate-sugar epimerase
MRHQRILVTGASGFIGSALTARLLSLGHEVVAFDRRRPAAPARDKLRVVVGDVVSQTDLRAASEGCDAVVHLAAVVQTHGPRELFERINVGGTRAVAQAAQAAGVRQLLFMSSIAVLDYRRGYRDGDETCATGGRLTEYGRSKLEGERIVLAHNAGALSTTIVRPGLLPFGPADRAGTFELLSSVQRRQALLVAGGRAQLSTSYVDNLVDGVLLCLGAPAARGEIFNITDAGAPTWRDLVDEIAAALSQPPNLTSSPRWLAQLAATLTEWAWHLTRRRSAPPISRYAVSVATSDLHFSHAKAKRLLGYEPRLDLATGLRASVGWFLRQQRGALGLPLPLVGE